MEVVELVRAGRFPFALAIGALILVVGLGIVLTVLQIAFGLSSRTVGAVAVPVFLGSIGVMIWFATGPQGTVAIGAEELVLDPRGRAEQRFSLPPQSVELMVYAPRSRVLIPRTYGPVIRLGTPDGSVSIATGFPELLTRHPPARSWETTPLPPDYFVTSEGFDRMARALGLGEVVGVTGGN